MNLDTHLIRLETELNNLESCVRVDSVHYTDAIHKLALVATYCIHSFIKKDPERNLVLNFRDLKFSFDERYLIKPDILTSEHWSTSTSMVIPMIMEFDNDTQRERRSIVVKIVVLNEPSYVLFTKKEFTSRFGRVPFYDFLKEIHNLKAVNERITESDIHFKVPKLYNYGIKKLEKDSYDMTVLGSIIMSRVKGTSFSHILKTSGNLPDDVIVTMANKFKSAFIHLTQTCKIIHGDLHLNNINYTSTGEVYIFDFGRSIFINVDNLSETEYITTLPQQMLHPILENYLIIHDYLKSTLQHNSRVPKFSTISGIGQLTTNSEKFVYLVLHQNTDFLNRCTSFVSSIHEIENLMEECDLATQHTYYRLLQYLQISIRHVDYIFNYVSENGDPTAPEFTSDRLFSAVRYIASSVATIILEDIIEKANFEFVEYSHSHSRSHSESEAEAEAEVVSAANIMSNLRDSSQNEQVTKRRKMN